MESSQGDHKNKLLIVYGAVAGLVLFFVLFKHENLQFRIKEYINFEEELRDEQSLKLSQQTILDSFSEISKLAEQTKTRSALLETASPEEKLIEEQLIGDKPIRDAVPQPPKNIVPESYRESVTSDQISAVETGTKTLPLPTILIGIGTGRCGTMAFSKLVDAQPHALVTHEAEYCKDYHWFDADGMDGAYYTKMRYQRYLSRANHKTGTLLSGDIALWNLPYVEHWLAYPNVKIVALKRIRADTIKSFTSWFGKIKHFPWMTQIERKLTTYSNMPRYDDCYPRYQFNFTGVTDQPSIAEAAEMYYDDYYRQVDAFIEKFPGRIKYVDSYEILNNEDVKNKVLDWLELPRPHVIEVQVSTGGHQTHKEFIESIKQEYSETDESG